jgi:uncharacterized short protein YbdD (DUF466 family)
VQAQSAHPRLAERVATGSLFRQGHCSSAGRRSDNYVSHLQNEHPSYREHRLEHHQERRQEHRLEHHQERRLEHRLEHRLERYQDVAGQGACRAG